MRKFFVTMMLAVALVFIGSQAEAREVYVGTYSDGAAVYLITETVHINQRNPGGLGFTCRVRAGRDYLTYRFWISGDTARDRNTHYENSEGYSGYVNSSSPVAVAIYRYVMNNWY